MAEHHFTESVVEQAALDGLAGLGCVRDRISGELRVKDAERIVGRAV